MMPNLCPVNELRQKESRAAMMDRLIRTFLSFGGQLREVNGDSVLSSELELGLKVARPKQELETVSGCNSFDRFCLLFWEQTVRKLTILRYRISVDLRCNRLWVGCHLHQLMPERQNRKYIRRKIVNSSAMSVVSASP